MFTHDGRRYHLSTGKRKPGQARSKAAKLYRETVSGHAPNRVVATELKTLIAAWVTDLADAGKSDGWRRNCELYAATQWLPRWSRLNEVVAPGAIQKYVSERQRDPGTKGRPLSSVTLYKESVALRRFLKWCKGHKLISEIPTWTVPKPVSDFVPFSITPEQKAAVLAKLPDRKHHPKGEPAREWFTVMWACGFRPATLAKLAWPDVDLKASLVTVRVQTEAEAQGAKRLSN